MIVSLGTAESAADEPVLLRGGQRKWKIAFNSLRWPDRSSDGGAGDS
jgi:hypothetical protein